MPPPSNPEQDFKKVQAASKDQQATNLGEDYANLAGFQKEVFHEPDSTQNPFARNVWERLQAIPGYEREEAEIMLLMRRKATEMFAVMRKKLEAQAATEEKTHEKLDALDAYLRTIGVVGESVKMQTSSSVAEGMPVKSGDEVLDSTEAVMLRKFANYLSEIDVEETINMVLEDQPYIDVLMQNRSANAKPLDDHQRSHLRRFILGLPEDGGKERSENRKMTEATLWLEIVRSLGLIDKRNLVGTFLNEGTVAETEDFISACIIGGVLTREEAMHIYGEGEFARKLGPDFPKKIDGAMEARKDAQKNMAAAVDRVEHVYVDNFANKYLTFNNFVLERIADLGVMTAGLNFILNVADRVRRRAEPGRKEGLAEAIVKGGRDAMKDKYLWFGVAEVGVGTEAMLHWMGSAIRAPSGEEKEATGRSHEEGLFKDHMHDHPEMSEYFRDHYDEYLATANQNLHNENPKQGKEERRGSFDLYPGDIAMTDEQAGKLGYANATEALGAIHRMFNISTKVLKLENSVKLEQYLAQNIWEAPDPHQQAQAEAPKEDKKKSDV